MGPIKILVGTLTKIFEVWNFLRFHYYYIREDQQTTVPQSNMQCRFSPTVVYTLDLGDFDIEVFSVLNGVVYVEDHVRERVLLGHVERQKLNQTVVIDL